MSTATDVQTWFDAVQLYDTGDINGALDKFYNVTQNSRILFNIGCCYLSLNEIEKATRTYKAAVAQDSYMAIGYFMIGLTNYLLKQYDESMSYYQKSLMLLQGNRYIDYQQLGLKFQLYGCEILMNEAVVASLQKETGKAEVLLLQAIDSKVEKKHERIKEALCLLQTDYSILPFTPPPSEIFRPPKGAVDNLKKKDYLGKAKVISTKNTEDIYACFSGIRDQKNHHKPTGCSILAFTSQPSELTQSLHIEATVDNVKKKKKTNLQLDRENMLKELRLPNRQGTLKRIPPPKKRLPTFKLGCVVKSRPLPSIPYDPSTLSPSLFGKIKQTFLTVKKCVPLLPQGQRESIEPVTIKESNALVDDSSDDDGYEEVAEYQKFISNEVTALQGSSTNEVIQNNTLVMSLNSKTPMQPPTLRGASQNNSGEPMKVKEKTLLSSDQPTFEVEVQYTFVKKVQLQEGLTLQQVYDIVKNQSLPEGLKICFIDDFGRQQILSKKKLPGALSKKKLYCFPDS